MDANGFVGLCRSIAEKIPNAKINISEGVCELKINGIDISLFFNPLFASDRMHCFVDIGMAPAKGREAIFSHLLSMNLLSSTKTSGVYGFDQESEKLIFVQQIIYPDLMDPDELATILSEYSIQARHLRQTLLETENLHSLSSAFSQSFQTNSSFLA